MGRTTAADKKKMLLKIYHTKKEPFNLKELTKLAKAAGLAEKLVQDVNTQRPASRGAAVPYRLDAVDAAA
jgi:hypothetical protein